MKESGRWLRKVYGHKAPPTLRTSSCIPSWALGRASDEIFEEARSLFARNGVASCNERVGQEEAMRDMKQIFDVFACEIRNLSLELHGINAETKIYRYIPLDRFLELIETGRNTLAHISKWEDPFEAYVLRAGIRDAKRNNAKKRVSVLYARFICLFGQSWTLEKRESDLFWRANGPRGKMVRIETDVQTLLDALKTCCTNGTNERCCAGLVDYVNEIDLSDFGGTSGAGDDLMRTLFVKRKEFSQEKEFRIVYKVDNDEGSVGNEAIRIEDFILSYPSQDLVQKVLLDPCMTEHDEELVYCYAEKNHRDFEIQKSDLFRWPEFEDKVVNIAAKPVGYYEFWKEALKVLPLSRNRNPRERNWMLFESNPMGRFACVLHKNSAKVLLNIDTGDQALNARYYAELHKHHQAIEKAFGAPLAWTENPSKPGRHTHIVYEMAEPFNIGVREKWTDAIGFFQENMPRFYSALYPFVTNLLRTV